MKMDGYDLMKKTRTVTYHNKLQKNNEHSSGQVD